MKSKPEKILILHSLYTLSFTILFIFTSCGDAENKGNGSSENGNSGSASEAKAENTLARTEKREYTSNIFKTTHTFALGEESGLTVDDAITITSKEKNSSERLCNGGASGGRMEYINLTLFIKDAIGDLRYYETVTRDGVQTESLLDAIPSPESYVAPNLYYDIAIIRINASGNDNTKEKSLYFTVSYRDCS